MEALVGVGLFNPSQSVPDRCTFEAGLKCDSILLRAAAVNGKYQILIGNLGITNQMPDKIRVCGLDFRTGSTPQNVPTIVNCIDSGFVFLAPGESLRLAGGGFKPATLGRPRPVPFMFTLIDLLKVFLNLMFLKEGDTSTPLVIVGPGQMVEANLFVYYMKESDTGTGPVRIARGEIVARVQ